MKKLSTNDIFSIFSIGDEEIYIEHHIEEVLEDSFTLLGMAIRGVENYSIINRIYIDKYGEYYTSVKESLKLKYFNGLVNYLERINISQAEPLLELKEELGSQSIKYALEQLLEFYTGLEMYEKCTIIFRFYDLFFKK